MMMGRSIGTLVFAVFGIVCVCLIKIQTGCCAHCKLGLFIFLLTLFFLSVALKRIDVGIGYAVWAGIGAVGAAVLGPVFFDESLTVAKGFWLAVIIGGVVWLKLADSPTLEGTPRDSARGRTTPAE